MALINNLSTELLVVYGLILFVLILIVFMLVLDRISNNKKLLETKILLDKHMETENLTDKSDINNLVLNYNEGLVLEEIKEEPVEVKEEPIIKEEEIVIEEIKFDPVVEIQEEINLEEESVEEKEIYNFTIPKIDLVQEIKYVEEDEELIKTNAQLELEKLTKELEELEKNKKESVVFSKFEEEQEENAIISLDELMSKNHELYEANEEVQYMDEGNEPINLEELRAKFEKEQEDVQVVKTEEVVEEVVEEVEMLDDNTITTEEFVMADFATVELPKTYETEFKSTPEISPVFGIRKEEDIIKEEIIYENDDTILEFEQTADYAKLDQELKKTNEFLQMLKELEKNL